MPGVYLHIILSDLLIDRITDKNLKYVLNSSREFFTAGSVGPDFPYASFTDDDLFLKSSISLADLLHTSATNKVPLKAFNFIKDNNLNVRVLNCLFSFFSGYISHFIADAVIHPFIRDKAGNYFDNKEAHRVLEMKLDVICFYLCTGRNLNSIPFADKIIRVLRFNEIKDAGRLFSLCVKEAYDIDVNTNDVCGWIKGMHRMLSLITGLNARLLRKTHLIDSLLYPDISDVFTESEELFNLFSPIDRKNNFLSRRRINFIKDCIPKYYETASTIILIFYNYIFQNGAMPDENILPPVNLDTGRLCNSESLDDIPYLWKNH